MIDYDKDDLLFKYLDSHLCYNITRVENYADFKYHFNNSDFDFCFIDINDVNESKFILHFIIHSKQKQRVLQVHKDDISCLFDKQCDLCKKYNVKNIDFTSREKIHKYLSNYDSLDCEFKKNS